MHGHSTHTNPSEGNGIHLHVLEPLRDLAFLETSLRVELLLNHLHISHSPHVELKSSCSIGRTLSTDMQKVVIPGCDMIDQALRSSIPPGKTR